MWNGKKEKEIPLRKLRKQPNECWGSPWVLIDGADIFLDALRTLILPLGELGQ